MVNITETIRGQIIDVVKGSIERMTAGKFELNARIGVESPRESEYGDFSTNIAMHLARELKKPPRQIAQEIIGNMDVSCTYIDRVETAGPGFINFYLKRDWLFDALRTISVHGENYGRLGLGNGKKVLVEFVSANPTGPLHIGNARGGALGDCIASVLEAAGYDVTREFYTNDAGNQIEKFGLSLEARYIQQLRGEQAVEFPEDGYHGDDIRDHARDYISLYGDRLLGVSPEERRRKLINFALPRNLERIRKTLEGYGVVYDNWFSEQSLYDSGELWETLEYLKDKGYTCERDGAVWFRATLFGAEKDEVLIRSNGEPTYYASDLAYHRNKFLKRKFDWAINVLGADHYGHKNRMKISVLSMGIDPSKLDIVIYQLVRLYRNGEMVRMSKRTGKAITLDDLIEEVGRDAARFFFNTRASGTHLDFDLDLAVEQSSDNPVYYVQYAHARICSMLRILAGEGVSVPHVDGVDLTLLKENEELALIKKLAEYPEEVRLAAETLEPSRLTRYVQEVAASFHSFYNVCRVKGEEKELMNARLVLVDCTRTVIRNILKLLKISAPESM